MHCTGNGLRMAINDALTEMDECKANGFDYKIGEIRGMKLRIVAESEGNDIEVVVIDGPLNFTAIVEDI